MTEQLPTLICAPALAARALKVQKAVKRLEKTVDNAYAKFKYTPIDDYYLKIKPLLDEAGLFVIISEVATKIFEVAGTATFKAVYEISLIDVDGNSLTVKRAVYTKYVGAQTSGTCLSYVQKFFYRTTFNIATGEGGEFEDMAMEKVEDDADAFPHAKSKAPPPKTANDIPMAINKDIGGYSFQGPPYRIIRDGKVVEEYHNITQWGAMFKKALVDETRGITKGPNQREVNRILLSLKNDKSLGPEELKGILKAMEAFVITDQAGQPGQQMPKAS